MKTILVADDELDIRIMLKEYLELEGYFVITAGNGAETIKQVAKNPDLILLDINMPDIDGFTVCEKIRDYLSCPILFLTARTEEMDKVNGFRAGGDDYIVKPFGIEELLARVKAHLRREERSKLNHHIYMNGDLVVDFSSHVVTIDGEEIVLTNTEYKIVEFLITHAGRVFDKEQIYEKVRGYDGDADATIVTEHIRRIRKKMKVQENNEYIKTVWGVGYKWIG
ncbi:two-component response regulator [Lachnospiraceae bacterium KM106-2]|nr:two-component response regulator [Lachnospiraceae bacterium KM106-2]